jgi:hypothetical protein
MGSTLEPELTMIVSVLFALFFFGWAFNSLVNWLGDRKDGYTSLLVVAGVLVTLGGVALIDWRAAGLALAGFAASGLPMVIGDVARTVAKREKALRLMRLVAREQAEEIERGARTYPVNDGEA